MGALAPPDPGLTRELVFAAITACVATLVLCAWHAADPHKEAQRYYGHHHPCLHHLMQLCSFIIFVAIAFNARFLVWHAAAAGLRALHARMVSRVSPATRRGRGTGTGTGTGTGRGARR